MKISNFLKRVFYNWHVKLISLALAFILWKYVDTLNQKEKYVSVDLTVRNIPQGYIVTSDIPDYVKVVVKGKEDTLSFLEPEDLEAYVDFKNRYIPSGSLPVEIVKKNLPKGITIKEINPSFLSVRMEKEMVRDVPIIPVVVGKPANGYFLEDIYTVPREVKIVGPESVVSELNSVYTREIDISGIKETVEKQVPLIIRNSRVKLLTDRNKVKVKIIVETRYLLKDLDNVKLTFKNLKEGLKVKNSELKIQVKLKVPFYISKDVVSSDVEAYVDCSGIERSGEYDVAVKVSPKIKGLIIGDYNPKIVKIKVEKIM